MNNAVIYRVGELTLNREDVAVHGWCPMQVDRLLQDVQSRAGTTDEAFRR